jgi:hypothetical protein
VRSARRAHPAIRTREAAVGSRVHVPSGHRRRATQVPRPRPAPGVRPQVLPQHRAVRHVSRIGSPASTPGPYRRMSAAPSSSGHWHASSSYSALQVNRPAIVPGHQASQHAAACPPRPKAAAGLCTTWPTSASGAVASASPPHHHHHL